MTTTTLFGSDEAQAARDLIGGTAIGDLRNDLLKQILVATANRTGGSGGSGTVTSFSFTNGAGISGVVTNPTTTPALALTLGAITPTTVQLSGSVSGTTLLQSPAIAGSAVITFPSVTGTLAITGNTVSQFAAGGTLSSLTGFSLRDTSAAFDATLGFTSSTALTQARALTFDLVNGSRTFKMAGNVDLGGAFTTTGSGTIALGGFTLTVPATGTAALRGTANTFSAVQTFSSGFSGPSGVTLLFGTAAASSVLIRADKTWIPGDTFQLQFGDAAHYIQATFSSEDIWNGYHGVKFTNYSGTPFIAGKNATLECVLASAGFLSWNSDLLLYRKAAATLQLGADAAGVTNQTFTAASRITSDGVGANLTIAPGNGRGGAGGTLILATYDTQGAATIGNLQTRLTIDTTGLSTFSGNVNVTAGTRTGAALTLSQTWNNAGVTCRGLEVAVTNTNSAADSTIFRILGGAAGTSQLFNIDKNGWVNGPTGATMVIAPAGGQNMNLYVTGGGNITCNAPLDAQAGISMADNRNITFATTNGTIIGTATNQKMGFWNATPVVRPAHIADPAGGAVVDAEARTAINAILAWQATLGLTAAA